MKFLEEAPLSGKRVLVRLSVDVPLREGPHGMEVVDDYRIRQILPTIHYLADYGAKIILTSHLGRPDGQTDRSLSLRPVWLYLSALLKKPVKFAPTLFSDATADAVAGLQNGEILALENLRFDKGEEKNSRTFALKLAKYADLYVNDAFAVCHHPAASLDAITDLLPSYGGLSLEREVQMLSSLMKHPAKPYVAVIGGAKIDDKLPALKQLLHHADRILVGGGVANTLLKAGGMDVKDSLVDSDNLEAAAQILKLARGKLIVPTDFIWEKDAIVDIGPKTREHYAKLLKSSQTIFWSGPLGKVEDAAFRKGSVFMAETITKTGATTIVGGGDTVGLVDRVGLVGKFSFVSTGGGATLRFLGGDVLPCLKALG